MQTMNKVMEQIPDNMITVYTFIFPSQDEAVKEGKKLVEDGFMFHGDGKYTKGKSELKLGYDDSIHKMMSKIELVEVIKSKKKARRKGIKV